MQLILYRHGEIMLPSCEKRFIGKTDYPLSPKGQLQMQNSALAYHAFIPRIYCSSALRSIQSAEIFADTIQTISGKRPEIRMIPQLSEIDMGLWENRTFQDIRETFPLEFQARGNNLANYRVPKGETFLEVQTRAIKAIQTIGETEKSEALIITHLGVIRTLRCYFLHLPLSELMNWKTGYGQPVIFDFSPAP